MPARAPSDLSAESKKFWRKVVSEYDIADTPGLRILETICHAIDTEREAMNEIENQGITLTDRFGQVKPNGLLRVCRDARAQIKQGLKALNLDWEDVKDVGRPPGT
jgi:P27 family predicted phage terminase small subunit